MPPELSKDPSEFAVKARMVGKPIDAYRAGRYPDFSRSVIQKVIDARAVLINGRPTKASYRVRLDDQIRVWLPDLGDDSFVPEDIPIGIIYEDDLVHRREQAGRPDHPPRPRQLERHARQRPPVPLRQPLIRRRRQPASESSTGSTAIRRACSSSPRTIRPTAISPPSSRPGRFARNTWALGLRNPFTRQRLHRKTAWRAPRYSREGRHPGPRRRRQGSRDLYEILERFHGYAARSLACPRPDGPTRSASTWPTSAIRSWPTRLMHAARRSPSEDPARLGPPRRRANPARPPGAARSCTAPESPRHPRGHRLLRSLAR